METLLSIIMLLFIISIFSYVFKIYGILKEKLKTSPEENNNAINAAKLPDHNGGFIRKMNDPSCEEDI